jgi:hypothetical protein
MVMKQKTLRVSIALPVKVKKTIKKLAKQSDMSMSSYCVNLIMQSM